MIPLALAGRYTLLLLSALLLVWILNNGTGQKPLIHLKNEEQAKSVQI
jgi:hypothetical protein